MENLKEKFERVKIKDVLSIFVFIVAIPYAIYLKKKRPDMWLICEEYNEARDNGYWLYKYVREVHPEQDCVYAINKKSVDYSRIKNLGEVIQYGGYKHWAYYLAASRNISSQKGGKPNAALCYVLEVYGILKNVRIFLQHGITINDVPWLHYKNTRMSLFVCGAKKEYECIKHTFGYPSNNVQYLGFARFDGLHDYQINKQQILVMPSWREWIATPTSKSIELDNVSKFTETEYYQKWNELLNSLEITKMLEEYNMNIVFYPHRNMQQYLQEFSTISDRVIIADWQKYDVQELLKESALLITDYSSISMDFGYMRKPMIYYQFDEAKFRKGQYQEGYFSYREDGFGPVCTKLHEVKEELEGYLSNALANRKEYEKREHDFFTFYDTNNCERNYEAIKNAR